MPEIGEVAVIVGGANGIGAATAKLMAERGWRPAVVDIDIEAAREIASVVGGRAFALDVSDIAQTEAVAAAIDRELGTPTALVVCSGAFQDNVSPDQLPLDNWHKIMRINMDGTYFANRVFGSAMARRGRGSIVNIASITGMTSTPLHAYGPTKAAIINMTQALAGEWGRSGVRVNSVAPGVTLVKRLLDRQKAGRRYAADPSEFTALGRSVQPNEVAEAIEFLASKRASAITGTNLLVDCGWMAYGGWSMYGGVRPAAI
jgi:NAD(P)-dependent dehydrogenase (short-subunit alcohol dehydrogenase family)